MGLNAIKNAINTIIKSNADSVNVIKDGVNVSIGEVRCIYEGKTISVWKKNKYYYLTFHANSGTGSMAKQTMPCGAVAALSANLFSKVGYLFQGWNPDADGGVLYTDEQEVKDIAGAGETLALYAIWKAITWYVKFNANGGSGSMANQAHTYDKQLALTKNAFTRTNYQFLGWGTAPSGDVVYADQAVVKNLKGVHGATQNLYAIWKEVIKDIFSSGSSGDATGSWTGSANAQDSLMNSANGTVVSNDNNCSVAIDITNFKNLVWKGNVSCAGTYGWTKAYIRGGSSAGGTNYFNTIVGHYDGWGTDASHGSFTKEIDVSGIKGNIYLSVRAEADGTANDSAVSITITTTDIKSYV